MEVNVLVAMSCKAWTDLLLQREKYSLVANDSFKP